MRGSKRLHHGLWLYIHIYIYIYIYYIYISVTCIGRTVGVNTKIHQGVNVTERHRKAKCTTYLHTNQNTHTSQSIFMIKLCMWLFCLVKYVVLYIGWTRTEMFVANKKCRMSAVVVVLPSWQIKRVVRLTTCNYEVRCIVVTTFSG